MKNKVLLFLWLIGSALQAQNPDPGSSFSLEEAVAFALKNGYSVQNAATDIEIAKKKVAEIRGIGIPQLKAEANFQDFVQVPVSVIAADAFNPAAPPGTYLRIPFGVQYNASYGYTASWLAFSGEYIVGLQAARAYREVSETQLRKSEIEVRESVTRAYNLVIILQENARILNENLGALDESLVQTRAFFKEGFVEETDVDRLELVKQNLLNTAETLKQQTEIAKNLLKFQMGYPVASDISLKGEINKLIETASSGMASAPSFDLSANIDNLLLDQSINLQKLEVRRQRANYLPTLSTFYTWKESRITNDFDKLTDPLFRVPGGTILGVNISMPIFQGLSQSSRVSQAKLNLNKLETQKAQALAGLGIQSSQSWISYSSALKSVENTKAASEIADKIYKRTQIKYSEGVGSSIEVIQSLNDYLGAQSNYISAVQQLLDARVTLDKNLNKF
ncbi:MAG: TolC family protein [Bacteroidetes bacterium]|nr:TolC family protein [Bacteroidota bacterium]